MNYNNFINNIWLNQVYLPKGYRLEQGKNRKKKKYCFAVDLHYTFASARGAKNDINLLNSFFFKASLKKNLINRSLKIYSFKEKYPIIVNKLLSNSNSKFIFSNDKSNIYLYGLSQKKDKILHINSYLPMNTIVIKRNKDDYEEDFENFEGDDFGYKYYDSKLEDYINQIYSFDTF